MNPMMYAFLSWNRIVVMSLCHVSFGAERSKKCTFGLGFARAFTAFVCSPDFFSLCLTVSGLAFRKNSRLSICEIRFTPKCGLFFLIVWIRSPITSGVLTVR